MTIHQRTFLLAGFLFFFIAAGAQDIPEELTLSRAVQMGLENNYQIKIADENLEIARHNNDWGVAGGYPNVNLNMDVNSGYTNLNQPASFLRELNQGNNSIAPGATLNWTLYDGSRVKLTMEQLEKLESGAEVDVRIAVENTIESIMLSYYQVLLREEQLEVLEEVLDLSRDRIEYEQVKQEFGQASTFDILQTRDAYLNDSTTYVTEVQNYKNAIHNLNLAMGIENYDQPYVLVDSTLDQSPDYELETLKAQMLANNNQLQNLFIDRELAQIDTRLQESERLPQIDMSAGGRYDLSNTLWGTGTFADGNDRDLSGIQNRTLNGFLNFSVSYNLFNGGVRNINIQNAKVRELTAQMSIEDLKRNLLAQLTNTYTTYMSQKELVEVTSARMENARRNLEIAEERFRGGLINSFDYRTIQLNYINASQARLTAVFNLKLTETELQRLVGSLVR